nr:MBL fold metallo-hydrolase [Armatimonas sp.]
MTVHCLASGSSGNAFLVVSGQGALLVDAGIGVRTLKRWCGERGVALESLSGILVTHEHGDHSVGAVPLAVRYKVPIVATPGTLAALQASDKRDFPVLPLSPGEETGLGAFGARALLTTHDAAEPCGFRVDVGSTSLVYATDTGSITPEVRAACCGASLLVIEANHDIHRLRFGSYSEHLKNRILARTGHLSNNAAADLVLGHTLEHGPAAVWFAHLSEVNNTPGIVRAYWKRRWQEAGCAASPAAVEIAIRDTPSLVWHQGALAVQKSLF